MHDGFHVIFSVLYQGIISIFHNLFIFNAFILFRITILYFIFVSQLSCVTLMLQR
nr:MAG TPA: hypothetical protein [Caudoviricetes sp.]